MHSPTKFLMGSGQSSLKNVDNHKGEIEAGLIARLKTDGSLSIASADGLPLGISLGRSLSNTARTAVARKGVGIPVLLTNGFTPVVGTQVHISNTTGKAVASGGGATGMNAVYASGKLTAVKENGTEDSADGCALIDFPGGL